MVALLGGDELMGNFHLLLVGDLRVRWKATGAASRGVDQRNLQPCVLGGGAHGLGSIPCVLRECYAGIKDMEDLPEEWATIDHSTGSGMPRH